MVAGRARLLGRCTFYAVLPVAGAKGQLPGLAAPPSSFLLLSSCWFFLFFRANDDAAASSSLWRRRPAAPTVSSVPRGYCRDVTSPFLAAPLGIPALPRWAASMVYSFGEWGGMSHGGTVRRYEAEPPRLPLSTPQQRSQTLGLFRKH